MVLRIEADAERRREAWDRTAWSTAHLMNMWSKRRITAARLLGRPLGAGQGAEQTQEQRAAMFNQVWEKFERLKAEGRLLDQTPQTTDEEPVPLAFPVDEAPR